MTRYWPHAALGLLAAAAAFTWPITAAIPERDAMTARVASVAAAILVCAALALYQHWGRRTALALAALSGGLGIALLLKHFDAQSACVVDFEGRPVIVGRVYSPLGQQYLQGTPDSSAWDLLDVAAGEPLAWTADSIRECRLLVSWAGLSAIPFLAGGIGVLIARRQYAFGARRSVPAPTAVALPQVAAPVYDAFISYRHVEPDRTIAFELVERLEAGGQRVAIDARDFSPNEHFLSEMERCIKQSRFVLCVITAHYVQSDHTSEEAIISKTLDLAERRKRLVPLIFDRVELPVWLHGLVGIDFTSAASVDPHERLMQLLAQEGSSHRGGPAISATRGGT